MQSKPELRVTVFSDYICPFCYIGHARLDRLRETFDIKVNWGFLEIHPETSPAGEPIAVLGYPATTWQRMLENLRIMAEEENLPLLEHQFTTNSGSALRLAEAAKFYDAKIFYRLHDRLFEAFFAHGENIGNLDVLKRIGQQAGLTEEQMERAWRDEAVEERLRRSALAARELGVRATPTFFIGEKRLDGAVPYSQLIDAARCTV